MFDYRQLQRFNIAESRLPQGSLVMFKPTSLWDTHKQLVEAGIVGLVGLLLIIAVLMLDKVRRRRLEKQLAVSEAQYRLLAEQATDMISVHRADGVYTYASPASEALFDYRPEELVGKDPYDFFHPDDLDAIRKSHEASLQASSPQTLRYRLRCKDGHYIWVETRNRAIREPVNNAIREIIALTRNITPQVMAEQLVQQSEQKHRDLFEKNRAVQLLIDPASGDIVDANPAAAKFYGYDRAQLKRMKITDINIADAATVKLDMQHAASGRKGYFNFRHRLADGQIREVEVHSSSLQMGSDLVLHSIVHDITDRKNAERQIREAYNRLEAFWSISSLADADVKTVSDHILASLTNMTGSEYGFYGFVDEHETVMTIHAWSGQAMADCRMAYKPQEFEVCKAGIWAEAIRKRRPLVLNDYEAAGDGKIGLPAGHIAIKKLLVVPFFTANRITSVAAVANRDSDYTAEDVHQIESFLSGIQALADSKRAESELAEHRERLEEIVEARTSELAESRDKLLRSERLASIGTLATGIAHEINNPLGIMMIAADRAKRHAGDPEAVAAAVEKIQSNIDRCSRIVKNVLRFSKHQVTEKQDVQLNMLVMNGLDFTRDYARQNNVALVSELADESPIVHVNQTELEQVIVNLVLNAIESCNGKGRVCVATGTLDDQAVLRVTDNGCGMTHEQIAHAFDPFYTTRIEDGGVGLGLSTVYGIITDHQGQIDISSELKRGSTFTVKLPSKEETTNNNAQGTDH
jgi:PAS domain S-box-containing protein